MLNGRWPHGLSLWNWVCDTKVIRDGQLTEPSDGTFWSTNRYWVRQMEVEEEQWWTWSFGATSGDMGPCQDVGSSELFVAAEYNNCYMSINIDERRAGGRGALLRSQHLKQNQYFANWRSQFLQCNLILQRCWCSFLELMIQNWN